MTDNINRYAYTDFTPKPYIYYHGIPFEKNNCNTNNNNQNRTIIRTLQNIPSSEYVIPAPANQQFISQAPITQSNKLQSVRKQPQASPIYNNNELVVPINAPVPYNQPNNAGNFVQQIKNQLNPQVAAGQHRIPHNFSDLWSKYVRKDKMFERYSCDCDK